MLTDWLKVAERIAVALERMAAASEIHNAIEHHYQPPNWPPYRYDEVIKQAGVGNGSQRNG